MNGLYDIYEKVYFKSLDDRERIISRAQINFTIYAGMLTLSFYMLRMIDYDSNIYCVVAYFIIFMFFLAFFIISAYFSVTALSKGYDYKYLPKCQDVLDYRVRIINYVNQVANYNLNKIDNEKIHSPNIDLNIKEHIFLRLKECIDHNNEINFQRMKVIRFSMLWLWCGTTSFLILAFLFAIADLDTSSPRKDMLINDRYVVYELSKISSNLNRLGDVIMCNNKPKPENPVQPVQPSNADKPIPPDFPPSQVMTESYKEKPRQQKDKK